MSKHIHNIWEKNGYTAAIFSKVVQFIIIVHQFYQVMAYSTNAIIQLAMDLDNGLFIFW
jgi:hypothetical protein